MTSSQGVHLPFELEPLGGPHYRGEYWPLTPEEVASLEETIGWKLDPGYVDFLLRYGVSAPVVIQCIPHDHEGHIPFSSFYGAPEDGSKSLMAGASEFLGGVPHLAFADADNGLFFMNEQNQIMFERAWINKLHPVANSFGEFLASFIVDPNYL